MFAHQPGLRTFSLSRRPARIYYRIKLLPERHFVLKGRWIEFEKHFFFENKKAGIPLVPATIDVAAVKANTALAVFV